MVPSQDLGRGKDHSNVSEKKLLVSPEDAMDLEKGKTRLHYPQGRKTNEGLVRSGIGSIKTCVITRAKATAPLKELLSSVCQE